MEQKIKIIQDTYSNHREEYYIFNELEKGNTYQAVLIIGWKQGYTWSLYDLPAYKTKMQRYQQVSPLTLLVRLGIANHDIAKMISLVIPIQGYMSYGRNTPFY